MLEAAILVEADIGGGIAELTAALLAMDHLAGHEPGTAEHGGGVLDLPFRQGHADRAGGDRPLRDIDMGLNVDLDAEPRRLIDEQAWRADPPLAEMEVVTDRNPADAQSSDQVMVNEILRTGFRPSLVEGHHDGARQPRAGQKPQLGGLIGEPELRGVRAEIPPRMGLERQGQRGPAVRAADLERGGDDGPVAEVNAIEIAHRHHCAPGDRISGRGVADNGKGRHFSEYPGIGSRDLATPGAVKSSAGSRQGIVERRPVIASANSPGNCRQPSVNSKAGDARPEVS